MAHRRWDEKALTFAHRIVILISPTEPSLNVESEPGGGDVCLPRLLRIKLDRTFEIEPGIEYPASNQGGRKYTINTVIPGPAIIEMRKAFSGTYFVTVEILPDFYPPDKTLVIPDGTSANITLEKSLDLIQWEEATPGIYNNTNSGQHVFFRINGEILSGP